MEYFYTPDDWKQWSVLEINKINETISSCDDMNQLGIPRKMISNFVFITSLETDISQDDVEIIARLFWLKVDLRGQVIQHVNNFIENK